MQFFRDLVTKTKRSKRWPALRKQFLKAYPSCEACGGTMKLVAHHIIPVHIDPSLELDPTNLITLCHDHHLHFAHLGSWRGWNAQIRGNADWWRIKIRNRYSGGDSLPVVDFLARDGGAR